MDLVNCPEHGENHLVLCCQHLGDGYKDQIYLVPEESEEATVWCAACEEARIKNKGWYDYADSVANWKVICSSCLEKIIDDSNDCCEFDGIRTLEE